MLSLLSVAHATSYAALAAQEISSPNGQFVLQLDPQRERHAVYAAADRTRIQWSFPQEVWIERYVLSNSGASVAVVS